MSNRIIDKASGQARGVRSRTRVKPERQQVLDGLSVGIEFQALGIRLAGGSATETGWVSCHAIDREDRNASAAINIITGHYVDHGGEGRKFDLFDLAIERGICKDFPEALQYYAEKAGLAPPATIAIKPIEATKPITKAATLKANKAKPKRSYATSRDAVQSVAKASKLKPIYGWPYQPDPDTTFLAVRFEKQDGSKTYRPFHKLADGQWVTGDPPGPLPLYRVDRIEGKTGPVFLVEGEKCADLACSINLLSVTTSHGAESVHKTDLSPLAGRDVVILPDNDAAGQEYAAAATKLLLKLDPPVRVKTVNLPLDNQGDDIEQFIDRYPEPRDADQIRADILQLAEAVPFKSANDAEYEQELAERQPREKPKDDRIPIELTTELHSSLSQTLEALPSVKDLYVLGDSLVVIGAAEPDKPQAKMRNLVGSPKPIALTVATLSCLLTKYVSFFEWKTDKEGNEFTVDKHPPHRIVSAVLETCIYPGVPRLCGITECPYPTADGDVVCSEGYHPDTGIYLRSGVMLPGVPDKPSQSDAAAAADRIRAFFCQFPFRSDLDWAVYLSSILTTIARPSIQGPVPGVAIVSNAAGSGKGLLVDCASIIATGRPCPTTSYPTDPQETTKVIVALALSAQTIVHFDNVETGHAYGSGQLDSAITSTVINDRILGQSKNTGALPLMVNWFLTGNNVSPSKDAHRRWLPCNLESPLEHPEDRDDIEIADLRQHVRERRADIVRDCLTIFRAYAQAGRPRAAKARLGSFEVWDDMVRGAVHFATGLDPCETRRAAAAESPERLGKLALLEGWRELPGGGLDGADGLTIADAIKILDRDQDGYQALRAALMTLGTKGQPADAGRIGYLIRGMANTMFDGMRFERTGTKHKVAKWAVISSATNSPSSHSNQESAGGMGASGGINSPLRGEKKIPSSYDSERCKRPEAIENIPPHPPIPPSAASLAIRSWPSARQNEWGKLAFEIEEREGVSRSEAENRAFRQLTGNDPATV